MDMERFYGILKRELIPAMGCTEPIAIAYAAAAARSLLGSMPASITVKCSGNIIKNVKGVVVPNSGGLRGIDISAILGTIGGKPEKKLQVLEDITDENREEAVRLQAENYCKVEKMDTAEGLHLEVTAVGQGHSAAVEIAGQHTNIISMKKDGTILKGENRAAGCGESDTSADFSGISVGDIYQFIENADPSRLEELVGPQAECNMAIAKEGIAHEYGVCVGRSLIKSYGDDVKVLARALPAAGSDARMSGCPMPVVINSGSGNQGMTVSLPVIVYGKHLGVSREKLLRALAFSNLLALYQKSKIGRLSAYCGAVGAACGSGAAIAYLCGETYDVICRTITNTLANVSGIVCDGAKPSCAAKIASAVDAAIMAYSLAKDGHVFGPGQGLVKDSVEKTVECIGLMAKEGMKETDTEILKLMLQ